MCVCVHVCGNRLHEAAQADGDLLRWSLLTRQNQRALGTQLTLKCFWPDACECAAIGTMPWAALAVMAMLRWSLLAM